MELTQRVRDLADLSEEAGEAILEVYNSNDAGVTYKEDKSPLTEADLASNRVILAGLKALAPEVPVLSEESKEVPFSERKDWGRFFLIDPLDGTKEFIKRNNEFTVNIALIEEGRPIMGVVHAPVLGVTYYATNGAAFKKTFKKGGGPKPIKPKPIKAAPYTGGTLRVVASRSHRGGALEKFLSNIKDAECVSMGSSLKLCLVAEGAAHIYPRLGPTMEWDTAAAHCVVEAAGGTVSDLQRRPLAYNKEDLLNPHFIVSSEPAYPWWKALPQVGVS